MDIDTGRSSKEIVVNHDCLGLAYQSEQLFVTSGQALYVYKMDGQLVRKLFEDTTAQLTVSRCAVSNDADMIFITDKAHNRLVTLDNQGNILATLTDVDDVMRKPEGVHVTSQGHVFVVCTGSQTVLQISHDGKSRVQTMARNPPGISRPNCVIYHRMTQSLLVGGSDLEITELGLDHF